MNKIKIISAIARWVLLILFILAPISTIVFWLTNGALSSIFDLRLLPPNFPPIETFSPSLKFLCFLITLIPTIIAMIILYNFSRLFAHYEIGEIFEIQNTFYIKIIALCIFIWEIVRPFYDMVLGLITSLYKEHYTFFINFDVSNLRGLIIATVLYVIAWIMDEAYKIKKEQDLTI